MESDYDYGYKQGFKNGEYKILCAFTNYLESAKMTIENLYEMTEAYKKETIKKHYSGIQNGSSTEHVLTAEQITKLIAFGYVLNYDDRAATWGVYQNRDDYITSKISAILDTESETMVADIALRFEKIRRGDIDA